MGHTRTIVAVALAVSFVTPTALDAKKKRDPNEIPQVVINKSKKKKDKEITQVLPSLKEPPHATAADVTRLGWVVTPLSARGLLSQQTRDALRWILANGRGGTVVRIRAFVAGTGDVRRIQELVSEMFEERRLPLPVLSVAQVGVLPLEGAQVVMEATLLERKNTLPNGVAFFSGQRSSLTDAVGPLLTAVRGANLDGSDVRRITCYLSSLESLDAVRKQVQQAFPGAATNFVQLLRGHVDPFAECEAAAALKRPAEQPVSFIGTARDGFSIAAMVGSGRVLFTSMQLGFNAGEADVKLAFDRLAKTLESGGAAFKDVVMMHVYTTGRSIGDRVNSTRPSYHGDERHPAGTLLIFEGLPGLDASFGMDVIAAM